MTGPLGAIVGPLGIGKDSGMQATAGKRPDIVLTRRIIPRSSGFGGEISQRISLEMFHDIAKAGGFALWRAVHGLDYGISADIKDSLAKGHDVLATLSQGVFSNANMRFPRF